MIDTPSGLNHTNVGADSLAVMQAKLKGDMGTLQLMASRGSFAALAALKEMTDASRSAAAIRSNSEMNNPEVSTVLSQLGGHQVNNTQSMMHGQPQAFAQAPKVGQAFAGGGLAFAEGGDIAPEDRKKMEQYLADTQKTEDYLPGETTTERAWRRFKNTARALANPNIDMPAASQPTAPAATGIAAGLNPNASPQGATPTPQQLQAVAAAQQVPSAPPMGTAQPRPPAPRPLGTTAPVTPPGIAAAAGPAAADDEELSPQDEAAAYLAQRKKLEDQRGDLTSKQLKNAKENFEGSVQRASKKDDIWDFIANVARNNGSSAINSLAQAGLQTHDDKKAREEKVAGLQAAYGQQEVLIKQADLKARMGDLDGAAEATAKAAELGRKIKQTEALTKYYESQAKTKEKKGETDAEVAAAKIAKLQQQGKGTRGAAGAKPMTDVQYETRIKALSDQVIKMAGAQGKDITLAEAREQAMQAFPRPGAAPTIQPTATPSASGWGIKVKSP